MHLRSIPSVPLWFSGTTLQSMNSVVLLERSRHQ